MSLGFSHKEQGLQQLRILLDIDDFGSNKDVVRSQEIQRVFSNGRHAGLTVLLVLQSITQTLPGVRSNTEVAMFSRSSNDGHRKLVQKEFMAFCDTAEFRAIYKSSTSRYCFLVVDTAAEELSVEKALSYYRADQSITPGKFGSAKVHFIDALLNALSTLLMRRRDAQLAEEAAAECERSQQKKKDEEGGLPDLMVVF